jgi:hypothetical protein
LFTHVGIDIHGCTTYINQQTKEKKRKQSAVMVLQDRCSERMEWQAQHTYRTGTAPQTSIIVITRRNIHIRPKIWMIRFRPATFQNLNFLCALAVW